ncbi:MAG: VWA domain-containing protein, partial [Pseudomonadales bacterium]|nr:VWA domain-containing protein [Pseudomonadales bacterium]
AYDSNVSVLVPAQAVGNRHAFHQAINGIYTMGSTALHAGWQQGAEMAKVHPLNNGVNRVILLSDGCANMGITDPDAIATQCNAYADEGITTSTYGLGRHFNELLMTEMAKSGRGNSYYGESAEDLMDPFREEFDLLTSLCARNISVNIESARGVSVKLLNRYSQPGINEWLLPDLAYGGEAWAVLRLTFDNNWPANAPGNNAFLLQSVLRYTHASAGSDTGHSARQTLDASLALPVLSQSQFAQLAEDETVSARCKELYFADLQEQASDAARHGDWASVDSYLSKMDSAASNNPWLQESLKNTRRYAKQRQRENFSKEARYHSTRLRDRLVAPAECSVAYAASDELGIPSFLRRKPQQGKRM